MLKVRFRNGRQLGRVEEGFAATLSHGDTFFFAGMSLEVEKIETEDLIVRATARPARIPSYGGARMPLTTNLANRVRGFPGGPRRLAPLSRRCARMARNPVETVDHAAAGAIAGRDLPA